ncbi:hypothetical protein PMAYCL1PPCAC_19482, partial [Pristionchus mayeri]
IWTFFQHHQVTPILRISSACNCLNLDECFEWQIHNLEGGSRGEILHEILLVDVVYCGKIVDRREKHSRLHYCKYPDSGCFEHCANALESLVRLSLDALQKFQHPGCVSGHTSEIDHVPHTHCLAEWPERSGCVGSLDDLLSGGHHE